jgi:hypothetical protein
MQKPALNAARREGQTYFQVCRNLKLGLTKWMETPWTMDVAD